MFLQTTFLHSSAALLAIGIWLGCQTAPCSAQSQNEIHKQAMQALANGNLALAEQLENQAITQDPKNALAHEGLAIIYALQGNNSQAITEAQLAVRLNPNSIAYLFNLAELLATDGRQPQAIDYYDKVLAKNPNYVPAIIGKSNCLSKIGSPLEALELLEKVHTRPNYPLQLQLAKTYFALGDQDKAEREIEEILRQNPHSYEAKLLKARLELERRNLPAAIIMSDELVKSNPAKSGAYLLLSECFVITHSGLLNAIDLVKSAKIAAQNKAFVFSHLAQDFERCAASTTKAEPDFAEKKYVWRMLSEECWRQAVKTKPDDANFRYRLAYALKKNRKFVESYYQVNKCLQLEPNNEAALALKDNLRQAKYDLFGWLKFYLDGNEVQI